MVTPCPTLLAARDAFTLKPWRVRSSAACFAMPGTPDALVTCTVIWPGVTVSTAVDVGVGVGFGPGARLAPGRGASSWIDFHRTFASEVHCTRIGSGG